jgi:prepilin-type N-terminal cleavage/methylation domain-containing protein
MRRIFRAAAGFTLAEIVVATAVVAIGLVAVALAFHHALSGIEIGRGETVATFLAEHKLEELKAVALIDWGNAVLAASTTTEYCLPAGGCTAAATAGSYRRSTTVSDTTAGPCTTQCKVVQVTVFYTPITTRGQLDQHRRLDVLTMFTSRT